MLDKNTSLVWEYLKNHFATSDRPVELTSMLSIGLSVDEINKSKDNLERDGLINVNQKYVTKPIESINL